MCRGDWLIMSDKQHTLRLAGVIRESIVDGPGIRMTIFVQGCPHHCKGCHNAKTWDFDGGYDAQPERLIEEAKKDPLLKGLTFSGGEPFCQAEALSYLGKLAHEAGLDVFTYTGYTFEEYVKDKEIINYLDVIVDGRFEEDKKDLSLKFRGSSNQRIWRKNKNNEWEIEE